MRILHEFLVPGTKHLKGALEKLPAKLEDGEVAIACYTHDNNGEIVVVGYYKIAGHYDGSIARPEGYMGDISVASSGYSQKAKQVCGLEDCWAGGDTGGFYLVV